jgi:hypothetical protein
MQCVSYRLQLLVNRNDGRFAGAYPVFTKPQQKTTKSTPNLKFLSLSWSNLNDYISGLRQHFLFDG